MSEENKFMRSLTSISYIESLMYITSKSPDMQFDVCLLRKYMSKPTLLHLHETKRVNRYQRGTTESEI